VRQGTDPEVLLAKARRLCKDKLYGGPGNDTILTADGTKDTVDCGSGRDIVTADKADKVGRTCEVVHRA
jgi:hypothetical protein